MSYEEQLSATRFMAERDLARQELDRMRPALEWVEEHGGLEKIRRQRRDSVPRAAYERKRGKLLKHIAECETALGKRKKRIEELEAEAEGLRERINRPAPVLAADGEPLREKTIVFDKDTGEKLGVDAVTARDVTCRRLEHGGMVVHYTPEFLTHERPVADTWERIEDDCTMPERDYYAKHIGHDVGLKDDAEIHEAVSRDLVRRAKKLAERGECQEAGGEGRVMTDGFDWRLVSHDNLCTHCVYSWPESVGFSCSVLRGKRPRAFVTRCGQYEPDADEKLRLRAQAERSE